MKLMTKEVEKKFKKFPLMSQDGKGDDAVVVVKYFNPCGSQTWLITEGNPIDNGSDWEFFGLVNLGFDWEWGPVLLSQLQEVKTKPFGLGLERDLYLKENVTIGEYKRKY